MKNIVLASKSGDRGKLFKYAKIPIEILGPEIDEEVFKKKIKDPITLVKELAKAKVLYTKNILLESKRDVFIIAADTIIEFNGEVIGKAKDEQMALHILKRLTGNVHNLLTGIAITRSIDPKIVTDYESTAVKFLELTEKELMCYLKSGDWKGRAGAYAITEKASLFIEYIKGSFSNVIGLPMHKIYQILKNDFNLNLLEITEF
ncbi:MAG: Maf family protein, partial [Candidatus Hodarchaeota archaeon]